MDHFTTGTIGVIGAGAWGTALAVAIRRTGHDVLIWGRDHQALMAMATQGTNPDYLPGLRLDPAPRVSRELTELMTSGILVIAVPAQQLRKVAAQMAVSARPGQAVIIAAKGIEEISGKLMSEIGQEVFPDAHVAMLSGPTFAAEVARGLPTAVTLACLDEAMGQRLVATLSSRTFRCYQSRDLRGVSLYGAMKNVIAIAAGIVIGRGLGENARAALIARGLAEMQRLGTALGAQPETLLGLAGAGDLALSATSPQSRNYAFGLALGGGKPLAELRAAGSKLTEGVHTAEALALRADRHEVELPICAGVMGILNGAGIDDTITALLERPLKGE